MKVVIVKSLTLRISSGNERLTVMQDEYMDMLNGFFRERAEHGICDQQVIFPSAISFVDAWNKIDDYHVRCSAD